MCSNVISCWLFALVSVFLRNASVLICVVYLRPIYSIRLKCKFPKLSQVCHINLLAVSPWET